MIIAQLSDFHALASDALYAGRVPANAMAASAIAHVNALDPRPDLVVISGDLVDTGTSADYDAVRVLLSVLEIPFIVLPGNHDHREPMRAAFADHAYLPAAGPLTYCLEDWPVRIIALDSTVPGKHHGEVGHEGLAWLDRTLAADPARPTLVVIHHQPFVTGIPYLDDYGLRDALELAAVISRYTQVERILCGHVHRSITTRFAGTMAMSCPSTSSQIALRLAPDAKPASYMEPPGGLLHVWSPDSGVVSHLFPVGDFGPAMEFF